MYVDGCSGVSYRLGVLDRRLLFRSAVPSTDKESLIVWVSLFYV